MITKETHSNLENKHIPDIDIDVANRNEILSIIKHIQASQEKDGTFTKHNVGIYLQDIPYDAYTDCASIDYKEAEERGYVKFDILNVDIYRNLKNKDIERYMNTEPNWDLLNYKQIVESLFHIGNHFHIIQKIKPKSLDDLALVIALKMPAKHYLQDKDINEIKEKIWKKEDNKIYFKKSHSYAYAQIVWIQLCQLSEM